MIRKLFEPLGYTVHCGHKLLRRGGEWLPARPAKAEIAHRYLKHRRSLAREAIDRLTEAAPAPEDESLSTAVPAREELLQARIGLNAKRLAKVAEEVRNTGAQSVVDLGCGEGRLLGELLAAPH